MVEKTYIDDLRSLPTDKIKEIILQDAAEPEGDTGHLVAAALDILEERGEIAEQSTIDEAAAWCDFLKYYNTPDGESRSLYDTFPTEPHQTSTSRKAMPLKRLASIAAVLCIVYCLIIPVFGYENIFELLGQWKNSLFSLLSHGEMLDDPAVNYTFTTAEDSLQRIYDMASEMGITIPVVPMSIPEGFALAALERIDTPTDHRLYAFLESEQNYIVISIELTDTANSGVYYIDEGYTEEIEIGDMQHYIMPNNDKWLVVWSDERTICTISTDLSREELIDIVKSIYWKG